MIRSIRFSRPASPRWLALSVAAALAAAGAVAVSAAPAAAASNVAISVGYADNVRATATSFPTPWAGSPSAVFAGCQPNCTFDSGAVRVVNNTPGPITVDSVVVKISTCTFDIWPHGTLLQAGQMLIATQTATTAAAVCGGASGAFDTSDIGVDGAATDCTQDGVIPEVDVSLNGVPGTYTDTGQVLNTGGVDRAACAGGPNESIQWTDIGSAPCAGSILAISPATQTQNLGASAAVEAQLVNSCFKGLQGALITITVLSGPNAGASFNSVSDQNGIVIITYTSLITGTDTLQASTTNPAGTITSPTVTALWQKKQSQLSINTVPMSDDFNDPVTKSAVLTDSSGPMAGQPVTLSLNGSETCSAITDSSGVASCSLTPGEPADVYPLTASFAGNVTDLGSTNSVQFGVNHEQTTLAYTGPTTAANGQPLTLSGVLQEDGVTPISGRPVAFTLGSGGSAQTCTGTTSASGSASCTIAPVNQAAATTSVPVGAAFAGDAFYQPASASATLAFQYLTGRAFGLSSSGLIGISPTPDTGSISTASVGAFGPPCVVGVSGILSADTLCARVVTTLNPGTSTATASVQDAAIGVLGLPVIKVGAVQSSSHTSCAGSTGDTTVTSISVGGVVLNVNLHPGADTIISVLGITVELNEQIPVAGADQGLTVNAVHIKALGLLDVVIASSTSDIHNC